jgi:hypothetical protein
MGFFEIRSHPGWLRTAVLLISAYPVARITGVSHGHQVAIIFDALDSATLIRLYHRHFAKGSIS